MTKMSNPTDNLELSLKNQGFKYIIGVDEVGRGPLAGPVVAAAVHIPDGFSKKRLLFYNNIVRDCKYAISFIDERMIDAINIREATKLAMRNAIRQMYFADMAIIDGNFIPELIDIPAQSVIGVDSLSVSIAAASIVAKVRRDSYMEAMHQIYPAYGFAQHKGYGTQMHRDAIKTYGPCSLHRKTFSGVKEYEGHNTSSRNVS